MTDPKHPDDFGYTAEGFVQWQRAKIKFQADEIERLREALREMLLAAEVDQLENLSICDIGSERAKMKNRAVASRCGMLLGKLRKIARAALGEGK